MTKVELTFIQTLAMLRAFQLAIDPNQHPPLLPHEYKAIIEVSDLLTQTKESE